MAGKVVCSPRVHKPWQVAITKVEGNDAARVLKHKGLYPLCLAHFISGPSTVNCNCVMHRQIFRLQPEAHQRCVMQAGAQSEKNILSAKRKYRRTQCHYSSSLAGFLAVHCQSLGMEAECSSHAQITSKSLYPLMEGLLWICGHFIDPFMSKIGHRSLPAAGKARLQLKYQ